MKGIKLIFTFYVFGISSILNAQKGNELKYSKFFDSFYKNGQIRYSIEPGISYIEGDLGENKFSSSFGLGAVYKVSAPVEIYSGLRYFKLSATDHNDIRNLTFCGNYYHINTLVRFYPIYDRIRTNRDRKRKPKTIKFYVTSGISLMHYNASPSRYGYFNSTRGYSVSTNKINIPAGYGFPIRLNEQLTLTPEFLFYYTFNEMLDGIVSSTEVKDHYMISSLKLEFTPLKKVKFPKKKKAFKTVEEKQVVKEETEL